MKLHDQLERWKQRGQINQRIIDHIFLIKHRLKHYWNADVDTPLVAMLLFHIACSLGRIERGGCASPLYQGMFEEMQNAPEYPQVLIIHQDLLALMPFAIPPAEQTYFLANLYSLILEQKQLKIIDKST